MGTVRTYRSAAPSDASGGRVGQELSQARVDAHGVLTEAGEQEGQLLDLALAVVLLRAQQAELPEERLDVRPHAHDVAAIGARLVHAHASEQRRRAADARAHI